jgi:uncharacterized membrane protein
MWQKLNRYYPFRLELVPLAILILAWYLAVANYPSLPEQIPMHFNAGGSVDSWGSPSSIFMGPVLGLFFYLLLTLISIMFCFVPDPKKLINLPGQRLDKLSPGSAQKLIKVISRSLFGLKILELALVLYIVYITIEIAFNRAQQMGVWFLFILAAVLALAFFMIWQAFRLTSPSENKPML